MASQINSTSPTTFTTGVLISDTTNSSSGARGVIAYSITPSAALDIQSTLGALCPPRMTQAQRLLLTPANGMIVYDTTNNALYVYQNGTWGSISAGDAPSNATYIIQTANGTLTNAQVLGSLATGLLKNTTTTGMLSIGVAGTDYYSPGNPTTLYNDTNNNLFVGNGAGVSAPTGFSNMVIGHNAGADLTSGSYNITIGEASGTDITSGQKNICIGEDTLAGTTTTSGNIAIGYQASFAQNGHTNSIFIGNTADASASNLTNAISIGAGAIVGASNSMVLGNGCNVGIGTSTPGALLSVVGGGLIQNVTSTTGSTYTALGTDYVILNNHTPTSTVTITIPTATSVIKGQIYIIADTGGNAASNNITIAPVSGNIDGAANVKITTNHGFKQITNDGTNWWSIG